MGTLLLDCLFFRFVGFVLGVTQKHLFDADTRPSTIFNYPKKYNDSKLKPKKQNDPNFKLKNI